MMKFKKILFVFPLLALFLCSWVDRGTIDTYYGSITFIDSSYDVAHLSGRIEYYLMSYGYIGLSDNGSLLNGSPSTIKGVALINGVEYPMQLTSNGGVQIQQEYIYNNMSRTTWVDYDLFPDVLPSSYSFSDLAPILILVIAFMIIPMLVLRSSHT